MFGLDIQCLPGDCVATTLLKCLKGSIKVDRLLDASSIAWYLQHIAKEDYDAEQANYETQDPQAKYRLWEVFVRNAILVQILETKPRNRRIEFYDKGVLRGYGMRKVPGRKKGQPNQEFDEARLRLAQRADDEYRRYCERHPHRSGRSGRRALQNDLVLKDEDANSPAMLYEELYIEIDQSCYAIKRCAESMMNKGKGHKHPRDPVSKAAPPTRPAPVHHRPGASLPETSPHDIAPPIAPFQEGGGSLSPSPDERASPANERRGSSRASGQSAAFPSHGGSREPAQGSGHGEAMSSGSPHQQPTRRSEKSHRPAASPTPSPRDPRSGSSRASSDRHTTSSIASSRVSSRAPSHARSGGLIGNLASPLASNERSGRPPLPYPDGGSNGEVKSVATTNDYLSVGGQPHLSSRSGSKRATSDQSSNTIPKASNKGTSVGGNIRRPSGRGSSIIVSSERSNDKERATGDGSSSSRGSNSTTTRISKGKELAIRSETQRAADSSKPSSDESDIESISSWHSDGGRGLPKWGDREGLTWKRASGERK